jgi:transcriptional regulator with XRE-family HTH domain
MKQQTTLGTWLRTWRKSGSLSMQEMADKVGTSKSYIYDLENDLCSPSMDVLFRIAKATNVRLSRIIAQIE